MIGTQLIARERHRQVTEEGFIGSHDDEHTGGELVDAAICYAAAAAEPVADTSDWNQAGLWPWAQEWWKPSPGDPYRDLVKAGALIAAELDRRARASGDDPGRVVRPPDPRAGATPPLVMFGPLRDGLQRWVVAHGHIEVRLFTALVAAHVAHFWSLDMGSGLLARPNLDVRHGYAIEQPAATAGRDGGCETGLFVGDRCVTWADVEPWMPGAFPITVLDTMAGGLR